MRCSAPARKIRPGSSGRRRPHLCRPDSLCPTRTSNVSGTVNASSRGALPIWPVPVTPVVLSLAVSPAWYPPPRLPCVPPTVPWSMLPGIWRRPWPPPLRPASPLPVSPPPIPIAWPDSAWAWFPHAALGSKAGAAAHRSRSKCLRTCTPHPLASRLHSLAGENLRLPRFRICSQTTAHA